MKKIPVIIPALLILGLFTGCHEIRPEAPVVSDGMVEYNTQDSMTAAEYSAFLSKEVTAVLGVLTTHAASGLNIKNGQYPIPDEIENCKSSITKVKECIDEVSVTRSAKDSEETRDTTLEKMKNALNTLENYQVALEEEDPDLEKISALVDLMKGDFTALSAQAGIYWR